MSLSKMSGSETVSAEVPAIFSSHPANSGMEPKMMSAPSFPNASRGKGPVVTATVKQPAALPARTPSGAFSTTMHSSGATPAIAAPFRYGSGFGLPWVTSLAVILRPGGNTPGYARSMLSSRLDCAEPVTNTRISPSSPSARSILSAPSMRGAGP